MSHSVFPTITVAMRCDNCGDFITTFSPVSELPEWIRWRCNCGWELMTRPPEYCAHGVVDGEWCQACNAESKQARNDPGNGVSDEQEARRRA